MLNETLTRRAFLRTLTVLGAIPFLPAADAASGEWIVAGKASHFPLGTVTPIHLPNGQLLFVRRVAAHANAAAFHALSARCTHKGCAVAWRASTHQFQCPCHNGRFDAAGRNISGPPPAPLPSLPVKIVRGMVFVTI